MALRLLADTSVLTRLAAPGVRDTLRELLGSGLVGRCQMSDLELGYSARSSGEWDRIHGSASVFTLVESTAEDFRRAGQVQRALAAAGLRGRKVPDLLIAAAAERVGAAVLHYDRDFEHISAVTGQPHEWILPAGSID